MSKLVEWTLAMCLKNMLNVDLVRRRSYTSRAGYNRFFANGDGRGKKTTQKKI